MAWQACGVAFALSGSRDWREGAVLGEAIEPFGKLAQCNAIPLGRPGACFD